MLDRDRDQLRELLFSRAYYEPGAGAYLRNHPNDERNKIISKGF